MITILNRQISEHFNSNEFYCPHCREVKIDENLVYKMENIFNKLRASKCIISSGYRCPSYDIQQNGFAGRHSEGLAADCIYYDKNGNVIPSKIVICVAFDLGELNGIANIDGSYVHLDNRIGSTYYGDELRGNSSYWTNPYEYFDVTREDVFKYTGEVAKQNVNVFYKVRTKENGWLSEVKNLEDYAGYNSNPITDVAIKVDRGSVRYRVHVKGKVWLPYVTGYDVNNSYNGYAGNSSVIDAIEVYYYTPEDIRPYKRAKYRVNNYSWQYDNERSNGQDGYAGVLGSNVTKFQIIIE